MDNEATRLIRKLARATAVAVIVGAFISSATANANGYPTDQRCAAELDAVEVGTYSYRSEAQSSSSRCPITGFSR